MATEVIAYCIYPRRFAVRGRIESWVWDVQANGRTVTWPVIRTVRGYQIDCSDSGKVAFWQAVPKPGQPVRAGWTEVAG